MPALPTEFPVGVKGMDAFGDRVVFAEVDKGEQNLRLMNKKLLAAFEKSGFHCDRRFDTPHVTVLKVRKLLLYRLNFSSFLAVL